MKKGKWQLPVIERRTINEQYIKHNAKYHYYEYEEPSHISISPFGESLCGRHGQPVNDFESIDNEQVILFPNTVCKKCYEKFIKHYKPSYFSDKVNGKCYGKQYNSDLSIPKECLYCYYYAFHKKD